MVPPVLLDALRLILGAGMLYLGADWLVKGAAGLGLAMHIAPGVVGATIVAYATSAPELTVSIAAALEGRSAIVLGNVLGSNIANLGLILGLTALIKPPRVEAGLIRRELPVLVSSTALPVFFLRDGVISRLEGLALLLGAFGFSGWMLFTQRTASQMNAGAPDAAAPVAATVSRKIALATLAIVGLVTLAGGGKVFVDGAVAVARAGGMSERVVGLTIVAIGTSLPELAASLVAVARGHSALAVGNVLGSNILNVLLILGATALVHPVEGSLAAVRLDFLALGALTLIGAIALRTGRVVRRWEGAILLGGYATFLIALLVD